MSTETMTFVRDLSIIIGVMVVATGGYFAFTKNTRETHAQALGEANTTIDMLEKQTGILEKQLEAMHEEKKLSTEAWQKREREWVERERKLEGRIAGVEKDYRSLVLTVTTMGFCANAARCSDYNPGDRRMNDSIGTVLPEI